jgi:hypothetical protein
MVARKPNGTTKPKVAATPVHPPIATPAPDIATKPAPAGPVSSAGKLSSQQIQAMKSLGIEYSEEVEERHLKLLFWGATATRKTETVLRNFPNVLLIDAEGNSDQCVKNKKIPPFQRVKTSDTRKILEVLDAAAKGLIRMPNGEKILTVCIDSISVVWSVQQEVAASLAEKKAQKYNKPLDDASITMQDWNKAKRPLKSVLNRFSKTDIPFLVLIAREKPLYEELPGGELKKIGVTANMVRDTEYDMNLALHFIMTEKRFGYEVTKVQGALGELFPLGATGSDLPLDKLFEYARKLRPEAKEADGDGENLADEIATTIIQETVEHTQANLIKYATEKGFSAQELGAILKGAGFKGFDPANWDGMIKAIDSAVSE